MTAVLFVLRAVVLILLWGFVIAAIVAVRHDIFGSRKTRNRERRREARAVVPPMSPPAPASKRQPAPSSSAARRLVIIDGSRSGHALPLADTAITIGRAPDSTLVLDDDYVSTRHARLVPRGDAWLIEDTGSTNGTYLDRKRVSGPTPVPVGATIRVGKTVMELRP